MASVTHKAQLGSVPVYSAKKGRFLVGSLVSLKADWFSENQAGFQLFYGWKMFFLVINIRLLFVTCQNTIDFWSQIDRYIKRERERERERETESSAFLVVHFLYELNSSIRGISDCPRKRPDTVSELSYERYPLTVLYLSRATPNRRMRHKAF